VQPLPLCCVLSSMALVKWTTPKVVRRHEWQTSSKRDLRIMTVLGFKWTPLFGLPALCAVWIAALSELHRVGIGVLCLPILLPLLLSLCFYAGTSIGSEYCLDSKGLLWAGGKHRFFWHQIQSWAITDHPRLPGIRLLTVKAVFLRRFRTRTFPFNPRTVDEVRLRRLLCQHVRVDP